MMDTLREVGMAIHDLLTYSDTQYSQLNDFLAYSSFILSFIMTAVLLVFIFINPKLRRRERFEDRLMFWECIIVLILNVGDLIMEVIFHIEQPWVSTVSYIVAFVCEFLYMLAIFQWLVFVDYSLYRSKDHIRRRYKHAVIPIIAVMAADIILSLVLFNYGMETTFLNFITDIPYCAKLVIELGYIIIAVRLVKNYDKESKEPKFLSLSAFVVPFILGCLFRFYDESLMALGIIMTYRAVIKRDRYLDQETGFYNRDYLGFLSEYRDKNELIGGNGILIDAKGHGRDMAGLLNEFKPDGSNIFALGEDRFLLLSESLRGSAVKMAVMTITEAAENGDEPYTPEIISIMRGSDETAEDFADRIIKSA